MSKDHADATKVSFDERIVQPSPYHKSKVAFSSNYFTRSIKLQLFCQLMQKLLTISQTLTCYQHKKKKKEKPSFYPYLGNEISLGIIQWKYHPKLDALGVHIVWVGGTRIKL